MKSSFFIVIVVIVSAFIINSCSKGGGGPTDPTPTPPNIVLPVLTTSTAADISRTTINFSGNITSTGGATVSARGVCYDTNPNPTVANNVVSSGSGIGPFSITITNLTPNTTYYGRIYATNSIGTAYSNEVTFRTQALSAPIITTNKTVATNIQFNTIAGGQVIDDGGVQLTARGVCWSTLQIPTVTDPKTIDGTGIGNFNSSINNLLPNTTYYLRAYATNSLGTNYGEAIVFVVDVEGNVYNAVTIGARIWLKENLKTKRYRNGDLITTNLSNFDWISTIDGAYCIYNDDLSNDIVYGKLYNWYAVNDNRGLCPTNWHIPTKAEWFSFDTIFGNPALAGAALKHAGTQYWQAPNFGATNSSQFSALPGGRRQGEFDTYLDMGTFARFWSASEWNLTSAYSHHLTYINSVPQNINATKTIGYSCRCVKN